MIGSLWDMLSFTTGVHGQVVPADDIWLKNGLPRFTEVLPYRVHDAKFGLYGLDDRVHGEALGFLLEGLPQIGISAQMERSLQEIPAMLAPGMCLQVSLYSDANVSQQLARYCRLRPGIESERAQGVYRQLARRRYAHLAGQQGELAPHDHRLFFSVTMPGSLRDPDTVTVLRKLRESLEALLLGCSMPTLPVAPVELIRLVGGLLNPTQRARRSLPYDAKRYLCEQCLLADTEIELGVNTIAVRGDGMDLELAALVASSYPETMRLGGMLGLLGDPQRYNLRYRGSFLLTLNVQALDPEEARMLVSLRSVRASSNAKSMMAWLMPGQYRRQQQDWQTCAEVLDDGGHLVLLSHQVVVVSARAHLQAAVEAARAVWRAQGFTLSRCEYLQAQGLLAAMPLCVTPGFASDLRRLGWLGRKTSHNAAHSMPVVSEWKGTSTPALLLVSRRGQLMNLDLFDTPGNRNAVIAGASGSGKSVLLNEIAMTELSLGSKVWVLDIGRSYQRACEYLGGEFIQFGADARMSLNPFSAVVEINADMRLLNPLFRQMIAPRGGLGDYQCARLEEALLETWQREGIASSPTSVRDTLLCMGGTDPRTADMATMLGPFTQTGVHGSWFQGPSTVRFDADYLVLELEELKELPELQVVVFMQLLFLISQQMYGDRQRRKLAIIDEAWDLMRGEHAAEFIEHGYRRSRKYNGAFLSASQSVADFYAGPAGRAAITNSDWMLLLAQKSEELSGLVAAGQLAISKQELEMLRSLRTRPGEYAEIFIRGSAIPSAIGRLTVDGFTGLLYTTRAEDSNAIDMHRRSGCSLEEAINAVLNERRHDVD